MPQEHYRTKDWQINCIKCPIEKFNILHKKKKGKLSSSGALHIIKLQLVAPNI